jgi:hypothetical protein
MKKTRICDWIICPIQHLVYTQLYRWSWFNLWEIQPWKFPFFSFAHVPATFLGILSLHSVYFQTDIWSRFSMVTCSGWTEYWWQTVLDGRNDNAPRHYCFGCECIANEHAFGASLFHVLRLCSGIKKLTLDLSSPSLEVIVIPLINIIFICISWFPKSRSASAHRCWLHAYNLCCKVSPVTMCLS